MHESYVGEIDNFVPDSEGWETKTMSFYNPVTVASNYATNSMVKYPLLLVVFVCDEILA